MQTAGDWQQRGKWASGQTAPWEVLGVRVPPGGKKHCEVIVELRGSVAVALEGLRLALRPGVGTVAADVAVGVAADGAGAAPCCAAADHLEGTPQYCQVEDQWTGRRGKKLSGGGPASHFPGEGKKRPTERTVMYFQPSRTGCDAVQLEEALVWEKRSYGGFPSPHPGPRPSWNWETGVGQGLDQQLALASEGHQG